MSYLLPHLHTGWHVDQAILSEKIASYIRSVETATRRACAKTDLPTSRKTKTLGTYLVDIDEVPDFNEMYELYDPCTCMFFFRNKHID